MDAISSFFSVVRKFARAKVSMLCSRSLGLSPVRKISVSLSV
jgi:hypothetical protein